MNHDSVNFADVKWTDDDSVKAFALQLLEDRDSLNFERQRQAEINIAWYRGHQETRWHSAKRCMVRMPNPNNRVRIIINLMQPLIDGYIAKLAAESIEWEVMPATGDGADFDKAKLSTQILQTYNYSLDLESIVDEADMWAILGGESFVKVCWDPDAGDPLDLQPEDVGMPPDEFEKEYRISLDALRTGDLAVEPIPLFNIAWGPDSVPFDEAEYVMEIHEESISYCMKQYGLSRDDAKSAYGDSQRIWKPGGSGAFGTVERDADDDTCLRLTLWAKKNKAIKGLERGRCVTIVGNKVVKNEPNPYEHGAIPILSWPFKLPPGRIAGETFVDQLIPPQADLNVNVSQQCENRELMGNPVWLAQQGTISNINDWVARPGGIREYKGVKPDLEQGAAMPAAVLAQLDKSIRFMQDIVGLHDVSQAKVPAGAKSGRAIALLKDSDNERFGPVARRREKFWAKIGHLALRTLAQFATEERVGRILGDENKWETVVWKGDQIKGQSRGASYFDVRVKSNGAPGSRAIQQEVVNGLVQMGFFKPENRSDKTKVLEILGLGTTRDPLDPTQNDRDRQRRENVIMSQGGQVAVAYYEDHEIHIEEVRMYQRSPKFLELPPQIQQLFVQHEVQHIQAQALQQFRVQNIVQQGLIQAGVIPPGPPQPPQLPAVQQAPPIDSNSEPAVQETP